MCVRDCEHVCLCARAFSRAYCEVLQAVLANKEISTFSFTFLPTTYYEGCRSLFCLCATCCQNSCVCLCVFQAEAVCGEHPAVGRAGESGEVCCCSGADVELTATSTPTTISPKPSPPWIKVFPLSCHNRLPHHLLTNLDLAQTFSSRPI